jgi:6-phosphogluconolactonase
MRTMMILHQQWTAIPFLFAILALAVVVVQSFTVLTTTSTSVRGARHCYNMNQLVYNPAERPPRMHRRFYAAPVAPERVQIYADTAAVSAQIRNIVGAAATSAIAKKGIFYLAIPGGSILKMLVGSGGDWTRNTVLAYVNHKCVNMDDENLATHAKAMKLFLHQWDGCTTIVLDGTANGVAEAQSYAAKLIASNIPTNVNTGTPIFDLALIGVGDDGHIGSLYPHRPEVLDTTTSSVLAVTMKSPPSITLSLPVMQNAHQVVVAACGVSEKYPLGKSDAMRRAIVSESETVASFPAVGLRNVATWIVDEAAASQLGEAYQTSVR